MELEFKDLTKNFGGFTAVDHINLVMTNGDAYVVHAAFAHERHNYL